MTHIETTIQTTILSGFADEQLRDELKRREEAAKQEAVPKPLEVTLSLYLLREACQEYIDAVATCGGVDLNLRQRIFEAAMMALFEPGVLDWLKSKRMA